MLYKNNRNIQTVAKNKQTKKNNIEMQSTNR